MSKPRSRSHASRNGGDRAGRVMTVMGSHLSRLAQPGTWRMRRVRASTA